MESYTNTAACTIPLNDTHKGNALMHTPCQSSRNSHMSLGDDTFTDLLRAEGLKMRCRDLEGVV